MAVTRRRSDAPGVIIFSMPFCSSSVNPYTSRRRRRRRAACFCGCCRARLEMSNRPWCLAMEVRSGSGRRATPSTLAANRHAYGSGQRSPGYFSAPPDEG